MKEILIMIFWNRIKKAGKTPVIIAVILVLAFSSGVVIAHARDKAVSKDTVNLLGRLSDALAEVASAARPAVVNISTTSTVNVQQNPFGGMFSDPFFRHFFGDRFGHQGRPRTYKSSALGSGVIVSSDGYILTNNHVIKGADDIKVTLFDKREFKGKVVGSDAKTDLAVVKINAKNLPALTFGESGDMKAGDIVLAVGNPFGLNQTITMGIVSAVGRSNVGVADYEDFIQTDAAINPGNSGGALVNGRGELVGINTAIFSTSGGYMGIGFAIPSDMAKSVMDSIIKNGKVIRGFLGVTIQDLTPDLAKSLDIKAAEGALISGVEKGSPAEKAGLKRGDLVVGLNGKEVADSRSLRNMVTENPPGAKVELQIVRDGKKQTVSVTLGENAGGGMAGNTPAYDNALKGVTVQELSADVRNSLNVPDDVNGVVVTNVEPDAPGHTVFQQNDVIQEVDRAPIRSVRDYERAVSKIKKNDVVLLLIYRDGGSMYITLQQ
jgi:Do/DeqQ family serine protease